MADAMSVPLEWYGLPPAVIRLKLRCETALADRKAREVVEDMESKGWYVRPDQPLALQSVPKPRMNTKGRPGWMSL
jgi:uncharacterized protein YcgL (UPF0745 family)